MKIGILGSGKVAQVLGSAYIAKGYEVMLGTRDATKLAEWRKKTEDAGLVGSFGDSAMFGDVIFLSVNAKAIDAVIELAGKDNFSGKTVIDLTNPLDFSDGIPPKFTATVGNSLGERVQQMLVDAHVIKAFNSIGVDVMTNPRFGGETATHFIAGNNDAAKKQATKLIEDFGWEVVDLGGIDQAFFLEALAALWVNYAFRTNTWSQAFKLLRR